MEEVCLKSDNTCYCTITGVNTACTIASSHPDQGGVNPHAHICYNADKIKEKMVAAALL